MHSATKPNNFVTSNTEGEVIAAINGVAIFAAEHKEITKMIKKAGTLLKLDLLPAGWTGHEDVQ
jgi:hypothetical protein